MKKDIRVSPKHGLNPSLLQCPYCGDEYGVALLGYLKGDIKAPGRVSTGEPCDKCIGYMKIGVILIEVDESKSPDKNNPYRTGKIAVVKDEAVERMMNPDMAIQVLRKRVCFIPSDVWDRLGLP